MDGIKPFPMDGIKPFKVAKPSKPDASKGKPLPGGKALFGRLEALALAYQDAAARADAQGDRAALHGARAIETALTTLADVARTWASPSPAALNTFMSYLPPEDGRGAHLAVGFDRPTPRAIMPAAVE
jgi:hypothetical protein